MRLGVLGSNNIYVRETTSGISDFTYINAIILKQKEEQCNINSVNRINLTYVNSKSLISLLKLPFIIKRTDRLVDGFIVHYMNLYFALLIASGMIINKPITYLCYGGDVRKSKIRNWCVKKALEKVDLIFVEAPSQKEYLHDSFSIPYKKLESSKVVFPLDPSFKVCDNSLKEIIRKKWGLLKKYIIFSPRTVDDHYNHHILIRAINCLEDNLKKDIQIVFTGFGDKNYLNELIDYGNANKLNIINLGKFLTPQEMSEIYNVSIINVNIPKHDQLGRSVIEGCLCGCISLLTVRVPAYHDFFNDNDNCVFVEPESRAIAAKLKWILENQHELRDHFYEKNVQMFLKYQNTKQIYCDLISTIESITRDKKEN